MILDDGPSVQISAILEKILSILNFLASKQIFLPNVEHHLARAYNWEILWRKTLHFWIFHQKLCMLMNYLRISSSSGLPKGSKTHKK